MMTSGPLIIGLENRQGNSNVKSEQVEELSRMLDYIEAHGLYVRMFRADCGPFIKELVEELFLRTETFYLRAGSCADRRQMYEQCTEWRPTVVNGQEMDVTSFEFTDFLSDWHLRLVVQRTKMDAEQGEQFLPGMEYMYLSRFCAFSPHFHPYRLSEYVTAPYQYLFNKTASPPVV